MKLNTDYWNEHEISKWRDRVLKYYMVFGFLLLANLIYFLIIENYIFAVANGIFVITCGLALLSHNQWSKENYDRQKQRKRTKDTL